MILQKIFLTLLIIFYKFNFNKRKVIQIVLNNNFEKNFVKYGKKEF